MPTPFKPVWLKASVLGCLWAASEIVLGSFLHNMRIPFSGNILTAIAIVLIVATARQWKETGIIWRAGLVCALMKTLSPSAVLFGPMISIFSEALLLEMAVALSRRTILGYLVGGALAMSWNLAYMILSKLLFYGFGLVQVYQAVLNAFEKWLGIVFVSYWQPLLVVLGFYVAFGAFSAAIGLYIAKRIANVKQPPFNLKTETIKQKYHNRIPTPFNYSIPRLFILFLFLPASVVFDSFTVFPYNLVAYTVFIGFVVSQYQQALKPLRKPGFIAAFIIITFLTSLVLGYLSLGNIYQGLVTGIGMNFRAIAMITGFAALGTELKNPKVKSFLSKNISTQLILALETAIDTLPLVIQNLPDFKSFSKKPYAVLSQLSAQATYWLEKTEIKTLTNKKLFIVTGSVHSGKTTFLKSLINELTTNGVRFRGFAAPAVFSNGQRTGFNLNLLPDNTIMPFSVTADAPNAIRVGPFSISSDAYNTGMELIMKATSQNCDVVIIDEIGPWELENRGWAPAVNHILKNTNLPLILVIRSEICDISLKNWLPANPSIISITDTNPKDAAAQIYSILQ